MREMDNLEKFIVENREAFDSEIPNLKVWAEIDKRINPQEENKVVRMLWVRRVAAAVAFLVIGAAAGVLFTQTQGEKMVMAEATQVVPEFREAEEFYDQQVKDKMTKLASYNPDPIVNMDLQQIDEVQKELKAELEKAPASAREEIIERMIENYKIKLGILERVLEHIDKNKTDKNHESI